MLILLKHMPDTDRMDSVGRARMNREYVTRMIEVASRAERGLLGVASNTGRCS